MADNEIGIRTPEGGEESFGGWIWAGTWIRENVRVAVAIAFVLGVVLGLVGLGWWLWPVQWTNAGPGDLTSSHKADYLLMIADSYGLTGNTELARTRLESLKGPGEDDTDLSAVVDQLRRDQIAAGEADAAKRLEGMSSAVILPPPPTPGPTAAEPRTIMQNPLVRGIGIAFFLLLLGAGVLLLLKQLQSRATVRRRRPLRDRPSLERGGTIDIGTLVESALAYFETTYNLGDEDYDVSYSIESPAGEFLGECGISALGGTGVGAPEGAVAFEVWLFDKEDVRTEARVLMSEQAFADDTLRGEMATRGEPAKAEKGRATTLETANLRLDAAIIELAYERGLDSRGFAKLTARLDVFLKEEPV